MAGAARRPGEPGTALEARNEVHLVGRVSGEVLQRELPSGDTLVTFRLVVPRAAGGTRPGQKEAPRPAVDTLDIACWTARTRAAAARLVEGEVVEVEGRLRRRFFAAGSGRTSRHEVEATRVRRVSR